MKKILSLEDLENFYSNRKKSSHFSAKESGYQLAVHIPAQFEIAEELGDDTVLFAKARVFHLGINRNKSSVTKEAAEKAMKTMAYKPVLAGFTDVNGELDFTSHDMEIDEENDKIIYLEKQIGCITADEPWFEEDEEIGKTYVCAYVAIPREYTESANIIERKNGTKVSVELLINEMNFSAKEKCLELTDVIVQGLTALGTNPNTGAPVEEGMYGSKITLKDFSQSNNSIFSELSEEENSKLIETLEKLNTTLSTISNFNINKEENKSSENYRKEEHNLENNIEVNEVEVNETEEITEVESTEVVETENEVEVTENESADNVIETESETNDGTPDVVETEEVEEVESENNDGESEEFEETENFDKESEDANEENAEVEVSENESTKEEEKCKTKKDYTKSFSISHEDTKYALYTLLEKYEQEANDYYYIVSVYDDKFVYQSYITGNYFGQKYTVNGDNISFDGNSYELYAEFLTSDEKASLDSMRSNYSSIQTELNSYKDAEVMADKMTVFEDEAYSAYLETEEFKALMSENSVKQFSKEELAEKADAALGKVVKATKTFAMETKKEEEKKPSFFAFARQETQSSFLDGLLKK